MQHYGAPTRLLDFTYSFFIAAYFAMEKPCEESSSHAIWAVRDTWAKEKGMDLLKKSCKDVRYLENEQNEQQWELQKPFFESLLNLDVNDPKERCKRSRNNPLCVFPVNAMRLNEQSTIQQGVFLCAGNVAKPFVENLENMEGVENEKNLVKLELQFTDNRRLEALERLHAMNKDRASLFPCLEGFAQSLAIYHPLIRRTRWNKIRNFSSPHLVILRSPPAFPRKNSNNLLSAPRSRVGFHTSRRHCRPSSRPHSRKNTTRSP